MSALVIHPEVRAFVEEVRAALDDLTAEEVEELTPSLHRRGDGLPPLPAEPPVTVP